jgi:hypothetical protein
MAFENLYPISSIFDPALRINRSMAKPSFINLLETSVAALAHFVSCIGPNYLSINPWQSRAFIDIVMSSHWQCHEATRRAPCLKSQYFLFFL